MDPCLGAGRGADNAAVVTCTSMASSNFITAAAVFDISRTATDCIIDRLHFCTQNPCLSSYKLYCRCVLVVR